MPRASRGTVSANSTRLQFDAHMAVNVRAPALSTEQFAGQHGSGDGLIVNLLDSKLAALNPDYLSYTLSKQALAGFTSLPLGRLPTGTFE